MQKSTPMVYRDHPEPPCAEFSVSFQLSTVYVVFQVEWRIETTTNLKFSVLVFVCIYFFISGADGYITLPTAWYYIQSLGLSKSFYGAVLAARFLAFILFSPVACKFVDKTRRVKLILLVCVAVKVIAYLIYAVPASGYYPLVGFFIWSANAAYGGIYGEIVRYTGKD